MMMVTAGNIWELLLYFPEVYRNSFPIIFSIIGINETGATVNSVGGGSSTSIISPALNLLNRGERRMNNMEIMETTQ